MVEESSPMEEEEEEEVDISGPAPMDLEGMDPAVLEAMKLSGIDPTDQLAGIQHAMADDGEYMGRIKEEDGVEELPPVNYGGMKGGMKGMPGMGR